MQDAHAISLADPDASLDGDAPASAGARARLVAAAFLGAIGATAAARVGTDSASAIFPLLHVALALAAGWLLAWEAALAAAWLTSVATQVPTLLGGPGDPLVTMLEGLGTTAVAGATLLVVRRQRERLAAVADTDAALPLVDPSSGLANANALELRASAELSRARRHDLPLTLVWIALEGLDLETANGELRRLGVAVLGALRGEDLVARVGPAELAVLLPEAGATHSGAVAERVEYALASALAQSGALAAVRAAVAAAHYPGDALTVDELAAVARERAVAAVVGPSAAE